jgi:hypothetical protein
MERDYETVRDTIGRSAEKVRPGPFDQIMAQTTRFRSETSEFVMDISLETPKSIRLHLSLSNVALYRKSK